ncbi:helix-turn-helix transcriptional regulator [Salmonella enterica]|nr:helix-turn-helix transcriptional regulator [Salmonella enterica]EAT8036346.1 helix-turn-helix transcriptional regulator [Salmonella enterica]EAV6370520.1 helix-turn-helix transcriptional regulator [Salmonella enterica]
MTTATENRAWRPHDTLPNRLKLLRAELDITQKECALRIGVTPRIWQGMEEGRAVRDLHKHVQAIADAYGVDRDWLLWGGALAPETNGPEGGEQSPLPDLNRRPSAYKVRSLPGAVVHSFPAPEASPRIAA